MKEYEVALFVSFLELIVDEISTFFDEISTDCRSRLIVVFDDMSHRRIVVFNEISRRRNGFRPNVVHPKNYPFFAFFGARNVQKNLGSDTTGNRAYSNNALSHSHLTEG